MFFNKLIVSEKKMSLETHEYEGYNIKILLDPDPENPREMFDQLGTILYVSSRYELGDERVSAEEIEEITKRDDVYWLPVFAYIHSCVVLSTGAFNDPWDSGQSGIIYVEKSKVAEDYGNHPYTDEDILARLKGEVEEYSTYLGGGVVGFVIEKDGEEYDSCCGFYSINDALDAAKAAIPEGGYPKTLDMLLREMNKALSEMPGEEIVRVCNSIMTKQHRYTEDGAIEEISQ